MFNPLNETANEIKTERTTLNGLYTKALSYGVTETNLTIKLFARRR